MIKMLLKPLLALILSRGALVLVGILSIALLIWFMGHHIGLDQNGKILAIGALIIAYLLFSLIKALVVWIRGRRLKRQLNKLQSADGTTSPLESKLDQVIKELKASELGSRYRGSSALYALPWYMVIGPSAAGKSTFFAKSGLNFPLKDNERFHVSGIGGTKDCDWWFSDQAILIDTAGRYTQEDENEEWLTFLRLLKANRSVLPINGVLLALPLDMLLQASNEERETHVKYLRARIQEVVRELGVMFPIYLVITKCDLLRGFEAFFDDLSESEVKQPWGVYLLEESEDKKTDIRQLIRKHLTQLHERLLEQRNAKLNLARNKGQRVDIYQFPSQFSGATEKLQEFTDLLFKANPYHETPWFAGLYFTSSTQEGIPLERKPNALKNVFAAMTGQRPRYQEPRSYFIDQLFTRVIFPLQHAVRGNRKRQRFHLIAKASCFIAASVVLTFSGITLVGAYTANQRLLTNYETQAKTLTTRLTDQNSTELERFDALVGIYQHHNKLNSISTYSPVAMIRRHNLIETHAEPMKALFVSTLQEEIESRVVPLLQQQLAEHNLSWPESEETQRERMRASYYGLLESYMMLTSHRQHYSEARVASTLSQLWYQSFGEDNLLLSYEQEGHLMQLMMSEYLREVHARRTENHGNPWLAGRDLIRAAQSNLTTQADADLLYQQVQRAGESRFRMVTLNTMVDRDFANALRSDHNIPGIYTREAWEQFVSSEIRSLADKAMTGDWVLGGLVNPDQAAPDQRQIRQLEQQIRQRYFQDYVNHWTQLIESLSLPSYSNVNEALANIKAISEPQGPIASVFHRLADELQLKEAPLSASGLADRASQQLRDNDAEPGTERLIEDFARLAERLLRLAAPVDGQSASPIVTTYLQELDALAIELEFLANASDSDREARRYAEDVLSGNAGGKQLYTTHIAINNLIRDLDRANRDSVQELMHQPVNQAWRVILSGAHRSLQQQWESRVYSAYSSNMEGRFPFADSAAESSPQDVSNILHPDRGVLWAFFEEELQPFLNRSGDRWVARQWLGRGLNFNNQFLEALPRADRIAQGLFRPGSEQIGMDYALYPIQVPGVTESYFENNGQSYRYRNEPQEWRNFQWNAHSQSGQARVYARHGQQSNIASLQQEGYWAFIRLLHQADIIHLRGTEFELTWSINNGTGRAAQARFRIRADREGSVLNRTLFQQFSLPRQIFRG